MATENANVVSRDRFSADGKCHCENRIWCPKTRLFLSRCIIPSLPETIAIEDQCHFKAEQLQVQEDAKLADGQHNLWPTHLRSFELAG